ncbi:MAG: ABC transporter substrate-binding protein [Ruminococcus sp.]|nr:ABC transporter substrate-binding protein [Ruminococcus sp.]
MKVNVLKRSAAILASVLLAGVLTACGESSQSSVLSSEVSVSESSSEEKAEKTESVGSLNVAWFPSSIKAALTTVAYAQGYFEDEGVTVNCDVIQNVADGLTALSEGKTDIVPVGITLQLQFMAEGQDFVFFGGSAQEGGAIITKPENAEQFAELSGWKGKKWASARSYTGDNIIRSKLRDIGIVPEQDIEIDYLNDDTSIVQAVSKGQADVGYITADGVQTAKNFGLSLGIKVGDIDPYYPCCRQTTTQRVIDEKHDELVAYHRGLIRAYKLIQTEQDKAVDILVEQTGQTKEYVQEALYGEYASRYSPAPAKQRVIDYSKYLISEGIIKDADISGNINTDIFRTALEQVLEKDPDDSDYKALKEFSDKYDT